MHYRNIIKEKNLMKENLQLRPSMHKQSIPLISKEHSKSKLKLSKEKQCPINMNKSKKDPILEVVIDLGNRKSETFFVYEGMNIPKALDFFSKNHRIKSNAAKKLKEKVMKEIESQKIDIQR